MTVFEALPEGQSENADLTKSDDIYEVHGAPKSKKLTKMFKNQGFCYFSQKICEIR